MKPIQLILIAVAIAAALIAGFMMMSQPEPVKQVETKIEKIPMTNVLVALEKVSQGNRLTAKIGWVEWPNDNLHEGLITKGRNPDGFEEFEKAIARENIFPGEPIRKEKLAQTDSGHLSAILPAGKRAVAVAVEAETSAGGFILPNDRVDVMMSYRDENDEWVTSLVVSNVRVLAVDQIITEEDGETAKVGETATLETTSQQALEITNAGRRSSRLTLVLRSAADINATDEVPDSAKDSSIRLIRYGKTKEVKPSQ